MRCSLLSLALALPTLGLGLLACNGNQSELTALEPDLALPLTELDFDEVVIGTQLTIEFIAQNEGRGELVFESVALEEFGSSKFTIVEEIPAGTTLDPNEQLSILVSFTPDRVDEEHSELILTTNDPENPVVELPVVGDGVEPKIDVEPGVLYFGDLDGSASKSMTFDVKSSGYGRLKIESIDFADPAAVEGTFSLAQGGDPIEELEFPLVLQAGEGLEFEVACTPIDDASWDQDILIVSNDPGEPTSVVNLQANTDYNGELPPAVEITSPDWGTSLMNDEALPITALITDDADDPEWMEGIWTIVYANTGQPTGAFGYTTGDASGNHAGTIPAPLPVGDMTVQLRVTDSFGNTVYDEVDVTIWEAEEPVLYTLSGGINTFDGWTVDDDVTIYLDGEPIFSDTNQTSETHSSIEFEATVGQTLRIVATDINACDLYLSELYLHFGTTKLQPLNDQQCASSCSTHSCYTADYAPTPNVFLDEEFVIAIP